jgi:acetylglutamate kinase
VSAPVGGPVTVKLGGTSARHAGCVELVGRLAEPGWVVVHGGGGELDAWSERLGLTPVRVDGLRVTDPETLDLACAVLGGLVNARLVARMRSMGVPALGLTGIDGGLLTAQPLDPQLGAVGEVSEVDGSLLQALAAAGQVPVVASLAATRGGEVLNVNADTAAGAIAAARGGLLILCTDVAGVLHDGALVEQIDVAGALRLLTNGAATAGMRPKLRAALHAARAGCEVRIVDGRDPDAVLAALRGEAAGTLVTGEDAAATRMGKTAAAARFPTGDRGGIA